MAQTMQSEQVIEVSADDLPLHCPTPRTPVWCSHPRVFLDVVGSGGAVLCPYCGTRYVYKGPAPAGH
jgi:uncharacterized Zn-finger protein